MSDAHSRGGTHPGGGTRSGDGGSFGSGFPDSGVPTGMNALDAGIHLRLVKDSADTLRFRHSHYLALLVGVLALSGIWAAWTYLDPIAGRVIITLVGALLAFQSFMAGMYRYELTFDLVNRTWRRRMGMVYSTATVTGSMQALKGVVLLRLYETTGSGSDRRRVTRWTLVLELEGDEWTEPVIVGVADEEEEGYRLLERYAHRLRVDAVDCTGDEEVRRPWDELDHMIGWRDGGRDATRAAPGDAPGDATGDSSESASPALTGVLSGTTIGPSAGVPDGPSRVIQTDPPSGLGITVSREGGRRRITLPPAGVLPIKIFQLVFGLLFAGVTGTGLFLSLRDLDLEGGGIVSIGVFGIITLIGVQMAYRGAVSIRAREWVVDDPNVLRFGASGPFGTSRRQTLAKARIEDVSAITMEEWRGSSGRLVVFGIRVPLESDGSADPGVVRVRSDDDIVYIGARLPAEGRTWLSETLKVMVAGKPLS